MSDQTDQVRVKQSGTYSVITHHPAWAWQCHECGWLGTGLSSATAALKEASDHACHPDQRYQRSTGPNEGPALTPCRPCAGTGEYPPTGGETCSWCDGAGEASDSSKDTSDA